MKYEKTWYWKASKTFTAGCKLIGQTEIQTKHSDQHVMIFFFFLQRKQIGKDFFDKLISISIPE